MKTKIFVTSDSLIDYISHPHSISSIPSLIKFFEIETYFDYIDMSSEKFFNRLRFDSKSNPEICPIDIEYLQNDINIALESYEEILIITSLELNYSDVISKLKEAYGECIHFYQTKATGHILAQMAIECDRVLKNEKTYDEAFLSMEDLYKNSLMLIVNPKDDIDISNIVDEEKRVEEKRKGNLYIVDSHKDSEIKDRDRDMIVSLIKHYLDYLKDDTAVTPFILYSSKYSYYLKLIESKLLLVHKRFKSIKKIPASPNMGLKYGKNIIAIGYTKNIKE